MNVVKNEWSNLPLAAGSVKVMSKTLQVRLSLHVYIIKCKIAPITYKFLLLQAISCHMAWLGRDFQCDFAPVAFVMFSHHVCIEPILLLQM